MNRAFSVRTHCPRSRIVAYAYDPENAREGVFILKTKSSNLPYLSTEWYYYNVFVCKYTPPLLLDVASLGLCAGVDKSNGSAQM